jgi:hypothetical protein
MKWPDFVGCIAVLALVLASVGCGESAETVRTPPSDASGSSKATNEESEEDGISGETPTATTIPDGTWAKGEYEPGTYRAPGGELCNWEQRKTAGGEASGEEFNENYGIGEKNIIIEIDAPYFTTEDCGTWTKVGG